VAIRNSRTYLEGVGLCNLGASRMELLETLKYQVNKWMAINDKTEYNTWLPHFPSLQEKF